MTEASIDATSSGNGHVRLALRGEVDLANADATRARIHAAVPNDTRTVDLDLTDLDYVDSSGLQVLLALTGELSRLQIDFHIEAPPRSAARFAIDMAGMGTILPLDRPGASPTA